MEVAPRRPETPEAAALVVERLRGEGLAEEASARLTKAMRRWPESPDLVALANGDS